MSSFEDRLWSELVREHGDALTVAGGAARRSPRARRASRPRRSWRVLLAAGAVALTATVVAGALVLTASTTPPAYAVVVNRDGSVTLTIDELIGVSAANARLAELGVRARVAIIEAGCTARGVRARFPLRRGRGGRSEPWIAGMIRPEKSHTGFGGVGMVIRPGGIPPGETLLLTVRRDDGRDATGAPAPGVAMTMGLYRGAAPACVPLR
jgi:hypothetical protein